MSVFEWSQVYSVGNPEMDKQHQILICFMNSFNSNNNTGNYSKAKSDIENLFSFTKIHFKDEEIFMGNIGYPDIENHIQEHISMLKTFESFVEKYLKSPGSENASTLSSYFKIWLTRHILISDKGYSFHFKKLAGTL